MPLILAVEPDERQAAILSGVVMNQLHADLVLVDSKDAAVARIRKQVPDLILLTTLMSPRDEEEILGHLRKMDDVDHLQTLTIPLLGSVEKDEVSAGGLLRAFKRKRTAGATRGCDPKHFAKEIRSYLKRAQEIKAERRASLEAAIAAAAEEEAAAARAAASKTVRPQAAAPPADMASDAVPEMRYAHPFEPRQSPGAVPAVETIVSGPMAEPAAREAPGANSGGETGATPRSEPIDSSLVPPPIFAALVAIEEHVARATRAIDASDETTDGEDEIGAMVRALRVPLRVATFAYPRGCRIDQIRLARPRRQDASTDSTAPPAVAHDAAEESTSD